MLTEQNLRDRIIFALRGGPLHRSALADSIPGFYSNYYDIRLNELIKEKRIIAYKERPNGVVRTAYQLAGWVPESDLPDAQHSVPDADSAEEHASSASSSELALFDALPEDSPDDRSKEPSYKSGKFPQVSRLVWKLPILVSVSFFTLFLVVAAFFPAANTTGLEDATMDLAMMEPAEPVLRTAPEIVYVGPPLTMEFKASTSTPAETLRSLVSGLPEDINTASVYLVRLTIQPSVKE